MSTKEDDALVDVSLLDALVQALPTVGRPSATARERLFAQVSGPQRFLPFLDRFAQLVDLDEAKSRERIGAIDKPEVWEDLTPGVRYLDFSGGPALGPAHAGLVCVKSGHAFPYHTHIGQEQVLVLQGSVVDDAGNSYRPGDVITSEDGSAHSMHAAGEQDAIFVAVLVGMEFGAPD